MIIINQFREYQDVVEEIAKEYYYINLRIFKDSANSVPRNQCGDIYIPAIKDKDVFAAELTHEVGHSVNDPITLYNYLKALHRVKEALSIDETTVMRIGNAICDIINEYHISKNKKLSNYRAKGLKKVFKEWFKGSNNIQKLLWAFYNEIHNMKIKELKSIFADEVKELKGIFNYIYERERQYIAIAEVLLKILEKNDYQDLSNMSMNLPVQPNEKELEKTVKQIMQNAKDIREVEVMIKMLATGLGESENNIIKSNNILKEFYQEKANQIRKFISYPKTSCRKGVKLGSRKWQLSDGYKNIDVKRTIAKFGVNIPLVTSRTARIYNKFISSNESSKPIDVVISIDVSGSTGMPSGYMRVVADYEAIMLYALIDEAKRLNQNVGLTLWSSKILFTTLPKCLNYREVEKLKEIVLDQSLWGGSTNMYAALNQAKRHKDKLFLIFTDGEVYPEDLIHVDNVVFFLIMPHASNYKMFADTYGSHRVIKIDDITKIPKVTLQWYRSVMR
ncbi:MAG: VWA domain-containing protein [archaeon GB-1867-005]|nr:VWA domain-containing protein [Candidatus Culexmicrobium cathedralense]